MSCCKPVGSSGMKSLPNHYEAVRFLCWAGINSLAIKALPQTFATWAGIGFAYQLVGRFIEQWPTLSYDLANMPEACAAGCTDIVAQSSKLKFDPRVSLLVASIFFCCHIEHHAKEMVPVVGAVFGFRVYHWIKSS